MDIDNLYIKSKCMKYHILENKFPPSDESVQLGIYEAISKA